MKSAMRRRSRRRRRRVERRIQSEIMGCRISFFFERIKKHSVN
jgi:hypothetical protein